MSRAAVGLGKRSDVVGPGALVEVDGEETTAVVAHQRVHADYVVSPRRSNAAGIEPVRLTKQSGETGIVGQRLLDVDPEQDPK